MAEEQTPEEVHEDIVETVKQSILRRVNVPALRNYTYDPDRGIDLEIDLLMLLENHLCIFEVKTGKKERKARKQLEMHRGCMLTMQNDMSPEGLFFSEVKTFWVSQKENKVVNTMTNNEVHLTEFLENPIPFLLQ